ncbi:hypothetical protein FFWV33_19190 [Flavobacterium faecale]|uniref:DUF4407 domain-containing protein n=1 Tax=Flavobacterium faecale TaxID=1355330 RepID=A0A2S1LIG1_9FLAO|nr:DUF4407 domain-containing protein [Flavobacterium faecale]AWG23507.1 hypothetical protein FFWV33_19190 [Flavobacterium faecale]
MRDFFIWCSGASVEIVKKCDDKEISKYANIGIVVFCVAFLSIFSATYFLSFAFNTEGTNFVWLYLPIGIIWAFIILSLDRAIVSTISKNDSFNIQILKSIPRVALALMIGIVVATPLEFKIFEKEVNNVIISKVEKIVKKDFEKDFQGKLKLWETKVNDEEKSYSEDKRTYEDEITGKKSGIPGKGKRADEYMRNELNSLSKLNIAKDSLTQIRQTIVEADQNISWPDEIDKYKSKNIGVIERVNVLYSLGGTHLAITILFILIELLPLLTKLLSNRGGYDELIISEERNKLHQADVNQLKESELKEEILSLENKKHTQKAKLRVQIEQNLQKEILTELSKAQNEIALKRVEEFRQKNLNNLNLPTIQQPVNKEKLEDKFWLQIGTTDKIEYFFRNGKLRDNELLYSKDGTVSKGLWNFNQTKTELSIELENNKTDFEIVEILTNKLKLKDKDRNDFLEFEKA